jgi:signal transduction histidine kinase
MSTTPPQPIAAGGTIRWLAGLNRRRVIVALVLGLMVALALNPIFVTPFPILLGRTLVIATVLLLAFTLAGNWPQTLVPRWVMQLIAVGLAAPLATFAVYVAFVGGDVSQFLQHEGLLSGFLWISGSSLVMGLLLTLGALYRERDAQMHAQALEFELERSTLARQALDAQLRVLHAQIEPHFLFNTLANVQMLVESGSPQAAPVLRSLIAYLRAAMPRLRDESGSTLAAEIELVRAYLEVMHLRMPDRLTYAIELPPELTGLRFPAMALLTLVENAIRHGIDPSEQGGRIEIGARRDGGSVRVWVLDTGVGLRETAQPGTGLANLRQRLAAFFGPRAQVELSEHQPRGVRAEIVFEA